MARTSKTMLDKSGESECPGLVPDLKENSFSYSPWNMMLAMILSYYVIVYVKIRSLYAHLGVFIINEC